MLNEKVPYQPTYVIEPESAAELARLMNQQQIVTEGMGGLFPEYTDLSSIHTLLDIACGPGAWALDVAFEYARIHVTGIDVSKTIVRYAQAQAQAQHLDNVEFRVMDVLEPLDFVDNCFDMVNAQFLYDFMPTTAWPELVRECKRVLRVDGVLRMTESEMFITNSSACERLGELMLKALYRAGRAFSPGGRHSGITPMLGHFLQKAGFQSIQQNAHVINFSKGCGPIINVMSIIRSYSSSSSHFSYIWR